METDFFVEFRLSFGIKKVEYLALVYTVNLMNHLSLFTLTGENQIDFLKKLQQFRLKN